MRRIRWLDLLLIAAIVPLAVWAWRTARERSRLEATFARYKAQVGDLDIPDPTKFYLKAIPTGSPTEFAWRAFRPAGPWSYEGGSAIGGGSMSSANHQGKEDESIWRVNFREREGGGIDVSHRLGDGRSAQSLGDQSLSDLIRGRWDQLRVEQVSADGLVVADPDKPVVLLRVSLSPELWAEGKDKLSPFARSRPTPEIFCLTINPKAKP